MKQNELKQAIDLLRSKNSLDYEEGFHYISGRVDDVLDELILLEQQETDGVMRSKFLELIGESSNPKAIALLSKELNNSCYDVRMWAYSSLAYSESKDANLMAESFKKNNPNEQFL